MEAMKGPYTVEDGSKGELRLYSENACAIIAEVYTFHPEAEATANLLAASWEMREALTAMREKYGRLHDFLSDAIESGRLTEAEMPEDYKAIADALCNCLEADVKAEAALKKAEGADNG